MLSIGVMSGGQAGYYLGLAREDYYLEGGEPEGVWLGEAAAVLGLPEKVEAHHLYNLFDGLSPDGSRRLVQLQKHEGKHDHRPGWDLTFSAPKSVSVLWSQSSMEVRQLIQQAHFDSVREALTYLEDTAILTRRGVGGRRLELAKALIATFEHSTSRAQDPQLHTHALLLNVGVRDDGTIGTISSPSIFQAKMAAGALYRAHFAHRLSKDLGLSISRDGAAFKVDGVLQQLCEQFSKRRQEIEKELKRQGLTSAQGAAKVTIETRNSKLELSRAELFETWKKLGEELGFGAQEASKLFQPSRRQLVDIEGTITASALQLMADGAHFSAVDLIRRLSEHAQGRGLSASEIRGLSKELMESSSDVIRLGPNRRDVHFTFERVLQDENSFFKICDKLDLNAGHMISPQTVDQAIKRANATNPGKELLPEQEDAVRKLTQSTGAISMMDGIAGSGKTRTLATAARAWEAEGFTVKGLALSGRAARELANKAGIECTTVAKALYELGKLPIDVRWSSELHRLFFDFKGCQFDLDKKTVLIVDEAGMVNTSHFLQLADACEKSGAKLVAVGDPRQLQAIQGASPFAEMIQRFGSATLDIVMRQKEVWARSAARDFADGRALDAMMKFAERGFVTVTDTQEEARQALFQRWSDSNRDVKDKLILTDRREDARILNERAQEARHKELGLTWITVGDTKLRLGDRVMFSKTSQARGVNNGDRGTLVAINPLPKFRAATVKLDSGRKVTVDLDKFPHLELGYASTTHRAQGETVREAFVLTGSAMQDKHLAYVQGTRAEEQTHFFLTKGEAGAGLTEAAKRMSRDRQRTTARQERSKRAEKTPPGKRTKGIDI